MTQVMRVKRQKNGPERVTQVTAGLESGDTWRPLGRGRQQAHPIGNAKTFEVAALRACDLRSSIFTAAC